MRQVFAVPGPITSEVSKGTLQLIQRGALLASCADDVLEFFDKKVLFAKKAEQSSMENPTEQKILEILQRESLEVDVLARTLEMPAAELGTTLSLLEIKGIIRQEQGKYYIVNV